MMKRFGESVRNDIKYVHRSGIYAILPINGNLLLTHQLAPVPEFQLPGGGIDPGEHPIAALHREVMEETGWKIARPRRVGVFRRFVLMPEYDLWAEKVCTVFLAHPVLRLGDPTEKGHSDHIVPLALARDLLVNPGDSSFVSRFMQKMVN
jgi:8-oxo-dGTP diphosphatase